MARGKGSRHQWGTDGRNQAQAQGGKGHGSLQQGTHGGGKWQGGQKQIDGGADREDKRQGIWSHAYHSNEDQGEFMITFH